MKEVLIANAKKIPIRLQTTTEMEVQDRTGDTN
jgi:hypothetical protein